MQDSVHAALDGAQGMIGRHAGVKVDRREELGLSLRFSTHIDPILPPCESYKENPSFSTTCYEFEMVHEPNGPPNSSIARALGVLRHRPFLIFWVGACISNTGNWTENAAQSWAVTSQTVGNPHQGLFVEILQFADFCPVLLLALIAGVLSDRVNRKSWLIILQAVACAFGAGLAVAAFLHRATPRVVITFTFLEGIVWALNGPVFQAVVPSLVPRAELGRAVALNSVQFNMARLCGPMLAAATIGSAGIAGAFTFNACTFLPLLIALLLAIPSTPVPSRPKMASITQDLREGLRFVWTGPGTRRLTIMGMSFMFLAAPLQGLLPVFAQSVLRGGPTLFGLMLAAIGLGSILGAFLLSFIRSYYPRRHLSKPTLRGTVWEAITAYSHHPDYPAEIAVQPERGRTPP